MSSEPISSSSPSSLPSNVGKLLGFLTFPILETKHLEGYHKVLNISGVKKDVVHEFLLVLTCPDADREMLTTELFIKKPNDKFTHLFDRQPFVRRLISSGKLEISPFYKMISFFSNNATWNSEESENVLQCLTKGKQQEERRVTIHDLVLAPHLKKIFESQFIRPLDDQNFGFFHVFVVAPLMLRYAECLDYPLHYVPNFDL